MLIFEGMAEPGFNAQAMRSTLSAQCLLTPSFLTVIMITTRDEHMAHDDFPFAFLLTCLFIKKKIDPRY
jgi:hypothetical protein